MATLWIIGCFAVLIFMAIVTFDSGDDLTDALEFEERQAELGKIIGGK